MPSKHILALTIGLSFSAAAVHAEEYRQHEAHVHGHAEFNIAQDGHDLLIEVKSPGADIVGFEHAPQDAQQEKALTLAVNKLKDATSLFTINPQADCTLEEARVSHTLNKHHEEHNDAEHEEHGHEDHDHEEHHDKGHEGHDHEEHHDEDHEGHDHEEHHDHKHGGHGEFSAQYQFHCENITQLESIDTSWFTQFVTTKAINANVFTDNIQASTELDKAKTRIKLK